MIFEYWCFAPIESNYKLLFDREDGRFSSSLIGYVCIVVSLVFFFLVQSGFSCLAFYSLFSLIFIIWHVLLLVDAEILTKLSHILVLAIRSNINSHPNLIDDWICLYFRGVMARVVWFKRCRFRSSVETTYRLTVCFLRLSSSTVHFQRYTGKRHVLLFVVVLPRDTRRHVFVLCCLSPSLLRPLIMGPKWTSLKARIWENLHSNCYLIIYKLW